MPLLMRKIFFAGVILMGILSVMLVSGQVHAASCETVAKTLNIRLQQQLNEHELSDILATLNETKNRELPAKFVTKKQAKNAGWSPGRDLWAVTALKGKSIGGDVFGNFEQRLPKGKWREADLDYRGGKRGAKRILFSSDGRRRVTIDHYQTFVEVPACR